MFAGYCDDDFSSDSDNEKTLTTTTTMDNVKKQKIDITHPPLDEIVHFPSSITFTDFAGVTEDILYHDSEEQPNQLNHDSQKKTNIKKKKEKHEKNEKNEKKERREKREKEEKGESSNRNRNKPIQSPSLIPSFSSFQTKISKNISNQSSTKSAASVTNTAKDIGIDIDINTKKNFNLTNNSTHFQRKRTYEHKEGFFPVHIYLPIHPFLLTDDLEATSSSTSSSSTSPKPSTSSTIPIHLLDSYIQHNDETSPLTSSSSSSSISTSDNSTLLRLFESSFNYIQRIFEKLELDPQPHQRQYQSGFIKDSNLANHVNILLSQISSLSKHFHIGPLTPHDHKLQLSLLLQQQQQQQQQQPQQYNLLSSSSIPDLHISLARPFSISYEQIPPLLRMLESLIYEEAISTHQQQHQQHHQHQHLQQQPQRNTFIENYGKIYKAMKGVTNGLTQLDQNIGQNRDDYILLPPITASNSCPTLKSNHFPIIQLDNIEFYSNDEDTRLFTAYSVTESSGTESSMTESSPNMISPRITKLGKLCNIVTRAVTSFGGEEYYKNPRFHLSFASSVLHKIDNLDVEGDVDVDGAEKEAEKEKEKGKGKKRKNRGNHKRYKIERNANGTVLSSIPISTTLNTNIHTFGNNDNDDIEDSDDSDGSDDNIDSNDNNSDKNNNVAFNSTSQVLPTLMLPYLICKIGKQYHVLKL